MNEHPHPEHDVGLRHDLPRLIGRRGALRLLAGAGVLAVAAGCGAGDSSAPASTTTGAPITGGSPQSGATTNAGGSCSAIPTETAGPFPGNGANGPDVLRQSGVVRRDIRSSFGSSSTVAAGLPLAVELVVQRTDGCAPYAGAAVYVWQCDRDGNYSLYSDGVEDENYLRGVQEADADGVVRFETVFPGCYPGRWPHLHFEVYDDLAAATGDGRALATSQLAFPEDACAEVYATAGYAESTRQLGRLSLERDGIFRDSWQRQLATMAGPATDRLSARLDVPV